MNNNRFGRKKKLEKLVLMIFVSLLYTMRYFLFQVMFLVFRLVFNIGFVANTVWVYLIGIVFTVLFVSQIGQIYHLDCLA